MAERGREFAIETGQIEGLYTLRSGITERLVAEGLAGGAGLTQHKIKAWHQLLTRHQATVTGLSPDGRQVQVEFKESGQWKRPRRSRREAVRRQSFLFEHLDWPLAASRPLQWINDCKERELTRITAVGAKSGHTVLAHQHSPVKIMHHASSKVGQFGQGLLQNC